jgi:hypothetical protein
MNSADRAIGALSSADPELTPLMRTLRQCYASDPIDLQALKEALSSVLGFLCSTKGRTDANCAAVDTFLVLDDVWKLDHLPSEYLEILQDMAGALHDTVSAPHIAENLDSTPEQLLARTQAL